MNEALGSAAFTRRSVRLIATLLLADLAMLLVLASGAATAGFADPSLAGELRRSGLASLLPALLLLCASGLCGTLVVLRAKRRAQLGLQDGAPHAHRPARFAFHSFAGLRPGRPRPDAPAPVLPSAEPASGTFALARDLTRIGRAARWPQLWAVSIPAFGAAALAWSLRATSPTPLVPPGTATALGAVLVAVAFLLLVAERALAALTRQQLAEAPALRALALVAVLTSFLAGLLELAAGLGMPWTDAASRAFAFTIAAIGLELGVRALGRLFLPAPSPSMACGATNSVMARLLAEGLQRRSLAAPIRRHLGIDFARSWALSYVRAAALPLTLGLLLAAWGLTGVVVVPVGARAVYERLGDPVRVLHPGLHAILPWPLGAARRVEYGAIHELPLGQGGDPAAAAHAMSAGLVMTRTAPGDAGTSGAEAAAPASADRLWEQPHPGELTLLIASGSGEQQIFQSVAADLRALYRVGLDDADARRSAYAALAPEDLVRVAARSAVVAWFAGRTLQTVLGASRTTMAAELRTAVQSDLDAESSGIEITAIVVEAVHPPAGAADAYHAVRAAEIAADASIFVEQGRASAIRAQSAQFATEQKTNAAAAAAETVDRARVSQIRFAADRDAAQAGGRTFLLERTLAALTASLARTPLTILDHRLSAPDSTVLDLRALSGASAAIASDGE